MKAANVPPNIARRPNLAKSDRRDEAVAVWERLLAVDPCSFVIKQVYLAAYESGDTRRQSDTEQERPSPAAYVRRSRRYKRGA